MYSLGFDTVEIDLFLASPLSARSIMPPDWFLLPHCLPVLGKVRQVLFLTCAKLMQSSVNIL